MKTFQLFAWTNRPKQLFQEVASPPIKPGRESKRLRARFEFIYTPKHGSWLNMAEIELHVFNGQCLSRHIANGNKIRSGCVAITETTNLKNLQMIRHV